MKKDKTANTEAVIHVLAKTCWWQITA